MSKIYNTKVSKGTKALVLQSMQENDIKVYYNTAYGYTVAIKYIENDKAMVSFAIRSEKEKKFRKSVGAFYAVSRMLAGEYFILHNIITFTIIQENCTLYTAGY